VNSIFTCTAIYATINKRPFLKYFYSLGINLFCRFITAQANGKA
jgi:hypothetical protein